MQKLLTFIVAAAMIYQIMNAKFGEHAANKMATEHKVQPVVSETKPELEGGFLERSLSKLLINVLKTPEGRTFFENMIQPVNKPITADSSGFVLDGAKFIEGMFRMKTSGEGAVGPASCGHIASISYTITTMDDIIVDKGSKSIQLGARDVIPALETTIIGMYVGQTREAITSSKYAYDDPKFRTANGQPSLNYKVKVTLLDIVPKTFMSSNDVRVFDDKIAYQMPYLCSERAVFDVTISSIDGKVIYDTNSLKTPISMILGDMAYPMIFSHALCGKIPTGTRTVIAQGKYLRSLVNKNMSRIFPKEQLPPEEFFLIEFKNFSQDGR
jgi:hypothetical protein